MSERRLDRLGRWLARRRVGRRMPVGVLLGVAVLFVAQQLLGNIIDELAGTALVDIPLWLKLVVATVIAGVAGVVYAAVRQSDEGPPDDVEVEQPAVPVAPTAPSGFVGREPELADVVGLVTGNQATAVVGGRAVGTSAFALRVVQEVRGLFPDGQVYVDLRDATAGGPLPAARALWRVIHRLGLPEPRFTRRDEVTEAAEQLHAWLATRRVLLVLDNVDDADQVRPLLTAAPDCRVLLAGSVDLERLDGVVTYHLGDLGEDEAVRLLAAAAHRPELATGDPADAVRLVNLCSRQPLAIRLVGELIRDRGWSVRRVVDAVAEGQAATQDQSHIDGVGDLAALRPLWEACDLTYQALPAAQRRLFRLLALVPATEVGTATAAATAAVSPPVAADLLDGLARCGLIESARPGRYRIRQLLTTSARRYLNEDSAWRVGRASLRLVRYYTTIAEEYADQLLPVPRGGGTDPLARDRAVAEASAWFRQEREVMFRMITDGSLARTGPGWLVRPFTVTPWLHRLAVALCTWFAHEGRLGEWRNVAEAVLSERIGPNPRTVEFWARNELATVHRLSGDPRAAADQLRRAEKLCRGRNHRGLAQAQTNLGLALLDQGDVRRASWHLELGLALRPRSDAHGTAVSALALGVASLRAEEPATARHYLVAATNTFDALGDLRGTATALNNLGAVLWEQNDRTGAREHWAIARERFVTVHDDAGLAAVLLNLGAAALAASDCTAEQARELLLESLRLTADRPSTRGSGLVHLYLGDAYARTGDTAEAHRHWTRARVILSMTGSAEAADAARRFARP